MSEPYSRNAKNKFEVALTPTDSTYSITWAIRSFGQDVCEPGMSHLSPVFPPNTSSNSQWQLKLYPNGKKPQQRWIIFVYLVLVSSLTDKTCVHYKLKIINSGTSHILVESRAGQWVAEKKKKNTECMIMALNVLPRWQEVVAGGTLMLYCELDAQSVLYDLPLLEKSLEMSNMQPDVDMDLKSNFPDDVQFLVKDQEFRCNKELVSSYSRVFEAMFHHNMKERNENLVIINDIEPHVFKDFIYFVNNCYLKPDSNVRDLLQVADKYDIIKLKHICEDMLSITLDVENAAELFFIADAYNAEKLKFVVLRFIVSSIKSVLNTVGYEMYVKRHPVLCDKILKAVVFPDTYLRKPKY